jgi:hypothetical protein
MVTEPEVVIDSVQRMMVKVLLPLITVQPTPCMAWLLHVVGVLGTLAVVPTHFTVIQPDALVSLISSGENVESIDAQVSSSTAQVAVVAGPVVCAMANGDSIKNHSAQMAKRIDKMGKVLMLGAVYSTSFPPISHLYVTLPEGEIISTQSSLDAAFVPSSTLQGKRGKV